MGNNVKNKLPDRQHISEEWINNMLQYDNYDTIDAMRIALLTTNLSGTSGWSRYSVVLARELSRAGHEVHALVHKNVNCTFCTEHPILEPPHHLQNPLLRIWNAWKIWKKLRAIQPDVVHVLAEPYVLCLSKKKRWKTILTMHGTYAIALISNKCTAHIACRTYEQCDQIISVSTFTKDAVQTAYDKVSPYSESLPITIIPNASEMPDGGSPKKTEAHRHFLMGVGAVKARKGYLYAIRACAAYAAKHDHPFEYHIYGSTEEDASYVQQLKEEIHKLNLEQNVFLHGAVSEQELNDAYAQANCFILLSIQLEHNVEGFGIVFLEANARGIPVIGPDTGGCPEAITNGKSGYICDPTDTDLVADRMHNILDESAIAHEDCLAWADQHNPTILTQKILTLYAA